MKLIFFQFGLIGRNVQDVVIKNSVQSPTSSCPNYYSLVQIVLAYTQTFMVRYAANIISGVSFVVTDLMPYFPRRWFIKCHAIVRQVASHQKFPRQQLMVDSYYGDFGFFLEIIYATDLMSNRQNSTKCWTSYIDRLSYIHFQPDCFLCLQLSEKICHFLHHPCTPFMC